MNILCRIGIHKWSNWYNIKYGYGNNKYYDGMQRKFCKDCKLEKTRYIYG